MYFLFFNICIFIFSIIKSEKGVNDMLNEYLFFEEKLLSKMSRKFGEKYGLIELEEVKVNYGLVILFINFFKFMFIYVLVFFLYSIFVVIIIYLFFIVV